MVPGVFKEFAAKGATSSAQDDRGFSFFTFIWLSLGYEVDGCPGCQKEIGLDFVGSCNLKRSPYFL